MAQNITLLGALYTGVPAVQLPKTGGGQATFTDVTPTTAVDSDVASGKIYFKSDGSQSVGTAASGTAAISVVTNQLYGGGEEKVITALDISDTTAAAEDVASGKYFYTAAGVKTQGTASGSGGGTWEDPLIPISVKVSGTYSTYSLIVGSVVASGKHSTLANCTACSYNGEEKTIYIPRLTANTGIAIVMLSRNSYILEANDASSRGVTKLSPLNTTRAEMMVYECEPNALLAFNTFNNN